MKRTALGILIAASLAAFPSMTSALSASDAKLARKYRPVLRFDASERWRPLEVESFLAESTVSTPPHHICEGNGACDRVARTSADLSRGSVLDIAGDAREGRDYRTPNAVGCHRPSGVVDCDRGSRSAIYYRVAPSGGRVIIDYWWFFRFNDFPRADVLKCRNLIFVGVISCSDHEGDWEGVRVIVTPGDSQPPEVRFDAHGRSELYSWLPVERLGARPVVYIAEGSHAAYPRPCLGKYCVQTGARLPEGGFDGKSDWGRNSVTACGATCLLPLPDRSWATWAGLWGRPCKGGGCVRVDGPRSPGRQHHRRSTCASRRTTFAAIGIARAARLSAEYQRNPKSRCRPGP